MLMEECISREREYDMFGFLGIVKIVINKAINTLPFHFGQISPANGLPNLGRMTKDKKILKTPKSLEAWISILEAKKRALEAIGVYLFISNGI